MFTFTIDGVKIGNLKTSKILANTDRFPVSQVNRSLSSERERSYTCTYNTIYSSVINRDVRTQDFTISSNWTFATGLSVVPDYQNPRTRNGVDVATVSYFYKELYKEHFCALSAKMYGDSSGDKKFEAKAKPSYIGMVVIHAEFNIEDKLKKVYGTNTAWKKLGGRFLLTVGSNLKNTSTKYGNNTMAGSLSFASAKRMGGTKSVLLETKHIASHKHTLCSNGEVLPLGKITKKKTLDLGDSLKLEPDLVFGVCTTPGAENSPDWGAGFAAAGGKVSSVVAGMGGIKCQTHIPTPAYSGSGRHMRANTAGTYAADPISISDLWGGGVQTKSITGTFQARFDVGGMTRSCSSNSVVPNVPHNNIPPFIIEYIWERIL